MPQILNRQEQSPTQKPAQDTPAVVKQKARPKNEPREIPPLAVVGAGVVAVLFILFLFHTYVHPFTSTTYKPVVVAPLPGFPNVPPYNVKEWQDMYKAGKTTRISGIPQNPAAYRTGGALPK